MSDRCDVPLCRVLNEHHQPVDICCHLERGHDGEHEGRTPTIVAGYGYLLPLTAAASTIHVR